MLETYLTRKTEFEILPMETGDCERVAALHGERFAKPWNDGEFHSLLMQPHVFGFTARQTTGLFRLPLAGFVLARAVAGEGEILTIAAHGKASRAGLGWRLMLAAMREVKARGGDSLFLEVDDTNQAGLGLYRKLGFETVGKRPAYYTDKNGVRTTALVMKRDLR